MPKDGDECKVNNKLYDNIDLGWWNDHNFMALLRTSINPGRTKYFMKIIKQKLSAQEFPLKILDVGCGGGLLTEQFARCGYEVTGVDISAEAIHVAKQHAAKENLSITYLQCNGNQLPFQEGTFDIVCCCDVLEHLDSVGDVISNISRVIKPDGIFFFDTINRTLLSNIVAIKLAQDWPWTAFVPKNLHVWEKFITPDELDHQLSLHMFSSAELVGLAPLLNPFKLLAVLIKVKMGRFSYAQAGQQLECRESWNRSIAYMGYARRLSPPTAKISEGK